MANLKSADIPGNTWASFMVQRAGKTRMVRLGFLLVPARN